MNFLSRVWDLVPGQFLLHKQLAPVIGEESCPLVTTSKLQDAIFDVNQTLKDSKPPARFFLFWMGRNRNTGVQNDNDTTWNEYRLSFLLIFDMGQSFIGTVFYKADPVYLCIWPFKYWLLLHNFKLQMSLFVAMDNISRLVITNQLLAPRMSSFFGMWQQYNAVYTKIIRFWAFGMYLPSFQSMKFHIHMTTCE